MSPNLLVRLTSLILTLLINSASAQEAQSGVTSLFEQQKQLLIDPVKSPGQTNEFLPFEQFKNDTDYLEPYEPNVISIPQIQLNFVRSMIAKDIELYKEVVDEGIAKRNTLAPNMKLMWKYSKKILGRIITNRRAEKNLPERIEPLPSFFNYLATLAERIMDRSAAILKERPYSKYNVDVQAMREQIFNILDTIQRVVNKSPIAAYHKWEKVRIYKNTSLPANVWADFTEESSDAAAVSLILE